MPPVSAKPRSAPRALDRQPEPLAVYVHWPWCLSKCPYCDFNSRPGRPDPALEADYLAAILKDLNHYAEQTKGRALSSLYFGGGTPSLMSPGTASAIIDAAARIWRPVPDVEITLEANPTSVEMAKFRNFREAGVNRVSIGVQALNDDDLQRLGREHSAEDARKALGIAQAVFNRYTFDLIYARPDQGVGAWEDELAQALDLAGDHISLYQLTVEPGTAFFRSRVQEAPEDLAVALYHLTQEMTEARGLQAYEISNHARPGAESRHNLAYWRGADYVGVGPGAHGRLKDGGTFLATHQIADPARWLDQVRAQGHGAAKIRRFGAEERAVELLLSGLRLADGIERARFQGIVGFDVLDAVDPDGLALVEAEGLVALTDSRLCVLPTGRLMLNAILEKLVA